MSYHKIDTLPFISRVKKLLNEIRDEVLIPMKDQCSSIYEVLAEERKRLEQPSPPLERLEEPVDRP